MTERIACRSCRPPCPLAELPSQEALAWHKLTKPVSFAARQVIFEQGEAHHGAYILCEGLVRMRMRKLNGRPLTLMIAGPGEIVGVGGFVGQQRYGVSGQALTEVRAHYLARSVCKKLAEEPSILGSRFIKTLAGQAIRLRRQCQLLASGASVRERLAALLLELWQRYEGRVSRQIEPKLSCEFLAEMLDAHRATVNEELVVLRQHGLVRREDGRIVIVDEAGLKKLAENVF